VVVFWRDAASLSAADGTTGWIAGENDNHEKKSDAHADRDHLGRLFVDAGSDADHGRHEYRSACPALPGAGGPTPSGKTFWAEPGNGGDASDLEWHEPHFMALSPGRAGTPILNFDRHPGVRATHPTSLTAPMGSPLLRSYSASERTVALITATPVR
jgi:hypothetical protein